MFGWQDAPVGYRRFRFTLPSGESIDLRAGDHLDLPADSEHGALVGPDGVVCLAARR